MAAAEPVGGTTFAGAGRDHFVTFYDDDESYLGELSGWLVEGLRGGDACIVIATAEHRAILARLLEEAGIDVGAARERGQYVDRDAAATLATFTLPVGYSAYRVPVAGLFDTIVGGAVADVKRRYPRVRAFGEMVAILCARGDAPAAIRLEELWNDLIEREALELACAYPQTVLPLDSHAHERAEVCARHTRVLGARRAS